MNNERRKALKIALSTIDVEFLTAIRDEEQEAFDNLPESLQQGEKGDKATEVIDALTALIEGLEEGIETVVETAGLPPRV